MKKKVTIIIFINFILIGSFLYSENFNMNRTFSAPSFNNPNYRNRTFGINYSMGVIGSTAGSYSWFGTSAIYNPTDKLLMNFNISLVKDLNLLNSNYIIGSGSFNYLINDKMSFNFSFQTPAIKFETNYFEPGL